MKILSACMMLLGATPSIAQAQTSQPPSDGDPRPVIWGPLHAGMTLREAYAAMNRTDRVTLSDGCYAVVTPHTDAKDRLDRVHLAFAAKDKTSAHCGTMVRSTLYAKYGTPTVSGTYHDATAQCAQNDGKVGRAISAFCNAFGEDGTEWEVTSWDKPDVVITFKIDTSVPDIWKANYVAKVDPTQDADPEAAGKL